MKEVTVQVKIHTSHTNENIRLLIKNALFDLFWYVDDFRITIKETDELPKRK